MMRRRMLGTRRRVSARAWQSLLRRIAAVASEIADQRRSLESQAAFVQSRIEALEREVLEARVARAAARAELEATREREATARRHRPARGCPPAVRAARRAELSALGRARWEQWDKTRNLERHAEMVESWGLSRQVEFRTLCEQLEQFDRQPPPPALVYLLAKRDAMAARMNTAQSAHGRAGGSDQVWRPPVLPRAELSAIRTLVRRETWSENPQPYGALLPPVWECEHCGHPVPVGYHRFCSQRCRNLHRGTLRVASTAKWDGEAGDVPAVLFEGEWPGEETTRTLLPDVLAGG